MDKRDLLNLPKIENIQELNSLLLFSDKQLDKFVLFKDKQYVSFKIPKKNSNKKRVINAPKKYLKLAQRIILREILDKVPCSNVATAFVKKQNGLLKNALVHKNSLFLLKLDFCDFFQSIKFQKVKNIFIDLGYNDKVSDRLAELCTFCRELPQGGICSPSLSNLACLELDNDLKQYCDERNIRYTRYADDLIFSSNEESVLKLLLQDINHIIKKHNSPIFDISINNKKTKFIKEPWHKKVVGITINNSIIKVSKKLKHDIRQELFFTLVKDKKDYNKIIGQIAFVLSIEKDYGNYIKKYANYVCKKNNILNHPIINTLNKMIK